MRKIIKKINQAVQLVLAAPVKLPMKVVQVVKYIALSLGILEAIVPDHDDEKVDESDAFMNDESLSIGRSEEDE